MSVKTNDNEIDIVWGKPYTLDMGPGNVPCLPKLLDENDWEKIPEGHGVYFFARRHMTKDGHSYTVRYIGQSENVRTRIKQHLNNMELMLKLKHETRKGEKVLVVGELKYRAHRRESGKKTAIKIVEKALIDKIIADSKGDYLFNKQGKKLDIHSISFSGSKVGKDIFGDKIQVS